MVTHTKRNQTIKECKIGYPAISLLSSMLCLSHFLLFKKMYASLKKKSALHPIYPLDKSTFIQSTLHKIYITLYANYTLKSI